MTDSLTDSLRTGLAARRPVVSIGIEQPTTGTDGRPAVLAVGIVLGDQLNTAFDTDARLSESHRFDVRREWIVVEATGGSERCPRPSAIARREPRLRPKYEFVNEHLATIDLGRFEFVLLVDDDVIVPYGFVDGFLGLQSGFGFAIAQPSRTASSTIDHPIVEQHPGLVARQTWFVEQGPVVSFHRSIVGDVVPFDLRSPMGWGYENVWSALVGRRGMRMGIIDAVPVDHSIRPVMANYSFDDAQRQSEDLLRGVSHRSTEDCMRVVGAFRAVP
jgi:hypothetical protein